MITCSTCGHLHKSTETVCPHCVNSSKNRSFIPAAVLLGLSGLGLLSSCKQEPVESLYGVPWDSGEYMDEDGDGFSVAEGDCDDTDATIFPGAEETADDTVDQNCDGEDNT